MKMRATVLPAILIAMTIQSNLHAADLGQALTEIRKKHDIVGLSVAGVNSGRIVWSTNLGLANVARGVPVADDTKFRIASISKTITATALMQLWEQGRFGLDDDISKTLGYSVVNPHHPDKPITFRQLLTHTSSFADGPPYDDFLMLTYGDPLNAPGLEELLCKGGKFYADGAIFSTNVPGTEYSYSNLGFGLLGTMVEKLSGERFDQYCKRHIFDPLDMTCSFNPADLERGEQLATLYRRGETGWEAQFDDYGGERPKDRLGPGYRIGHNALPCAPQGGLRANAVDLSKFMRAFKDPTFGESKGVLKEKTIRLMLGQLPGDGTGGTALTPLAFHRATELKEGEKWIGHTGSAYGLQSMMFWEEKGSLGFILLTNGSTADEDATYSDMEREIFTVVLQHLRESVQKD